MIASWLEATLLPAVSVCQPVWLLAGCSLCPSAFLHTCLLKLVFVGLPACLLQTISVSELAVPTSWLQSLSVSLPASVLAAAGVC